MHRQVLVPFMLLGLLVGAAYLQRPDHGAAPAGEVPGARPRPALRPVPAPTEIEEAGLPPGGPHVLPEALSSNPGPAGGPQAPPRRKSKRMGRPPLRPAPPEAASTPRSRPGPSLPPAVLLPDAGRLAGPPISGEELAGEPPSPSGRIAPATEGTEARPPTDALSAARPSPPPQPVLFPPILLTAPNDTLTETETAAVLLDRQLLTPQLRVTALAGRVVLAVLVRADGSVAQVTIRVASGNDLLDAAAVRAAGAWRFRPATRDGVPTEAWAIIPVRFVVP